MRTTLAIVFPVALLTSGCGGEAEDKKTSISASTPQASGLGIDLLDGRFALQDAPNDPTPFTERGEQPAPMELAALKWGHAQRNLDSSDQPAPQYHLAVAAEVPTGGHSLSVLATRLVGSDPVVQEFALVLERPAQDAMVTQALGFVGVQVSLDPSAESVRVLVADTRVTPADAGAFTFENVEGWVPDPVTDRAWREALYTLEVTRARSQDPTPDATSPFVSFEQETKGEER